MFVSLNIPTMTAKVRLLSDQRNSNFTTDEEIKSLMQDVFEQLFNELTLLNEGYFLKQADIKPTNKNEIVFPNDLYKVQLLERIDGDVTYPIYEKTLQEVSGVSAPLIYGYIAPNPYGYILFQDRLKLYPEDSVEGLNFRLSYSRDPLTVETDKIQKTWEKYISYKTAYIITTIQDNPRASLADLAMEYQNNIKEYASERNRGVRTIQDLERYGEYSHHSILGF